MALLKTEMDQNKPDDDELLQRLSSGDSKAFEELVERYRPRLKRAVRLRINHHLTGRIDESDIVQEAAIQANHSLKDYLADPKLPLFLWLRRLTFQKLVDAHRMHLGAQKRAADLEVSIDRRLPQISSASLAAQLIGGLTSPSEAAIRGEVVSRVQEALNSLQPIDREILALRHFEQLSTAETALALEIDRSTASSRYLRALKRLRSVLGEFPELRL